MKNSEQSAFPIEYNIQAEDSRFNGLTKREYTAIMAMQGLCGAIKMGLFDAIDDKEKYAKTISNLAIEITDELLKQLEK